MPDTFRLELASQERMTLATNALSVVAPGAEGYLGILAHHAPLIAALGVGDLTVVDETGRESHVAITSGFLEVSGNVATVLADTAELAEEIDVERARVALERAQARLRDRPEGTDVERAYGALHRALNRLKVAQR